MNILLNKTENEFHLIEKEAISHETTYILHL